MKPVKADDREMKGNESGGGEMGRCPVCGYQGTAVDRRAVKHLVLEDCRKRVQGNGYRICMNEACEVVYFNPDDGMRFLKSQVSVPIWFKTDASPKYACYCSKVTEDQVLEAVLKQGASTVKEVNAITGAMDHPNCKENNPLGVCCHPIIQKAIDKALGMK